MSKLDELINKLCPNGVEFKKIEEVCDNVFAGGTPRTSNKDYYGGNIPWLRSGEINFNIIDDAEIKITEKGLNESSAKWIKEYSVLIAMTGATVARSAVNTKRITANQSVCAMEPSEIVNYKFLYYYVESMYNNIKGMAQGALTSINLSIIKSISIPVPPLEVQCEIVRILDNFTLLSAELSAELSARQKQYNFYRENLLTNDFEKNVKLKDLCDIKGRIGFRGYTRNDLVEEGQGAISFSPGNIINETINYNNCTYISWKKYEESPEIMINNGDIILCKTGSTLGKVAMVKNLPEKATLNPQLVVLKNLKCNSTYLKYIIGGYDFQYAMQAKKGLGSVPNISQKDIGNIEIRLHSPENQEKIASILDRFDKLCNDISEGLPAEIEARKKQYEYYRDKLLTFKELK
ncbi:restriction endonuclease subunit S [Campylobacter devanensis]|uniref:restriction endonuclease subunit S n=1 Tax=Campylobacter devanensis TaxID=3161138 RepID=UPI000A33B1FC|nr:restriction endonuclease subunit S [Campylobacter sp. P0135]